MTQDISDLFDLAVELEREGAEFYEKLSHLARNESTKAIFKNFADDERKHVQIFLDLKRSDTASIDTTIDDDIDDLLKQFSHEEVLPPVDDENVKKFHPLTAIKLGIKTEKNTVKLYKRILKKIKNNPGKKALEELIKEEKRHAAELTELHKNKTFDF